jgi:hypothetical protein
MGYKDAANAGSRSSVGASARDCLPSVEDLGRKEWPARYRALVAEDSFEANLGRHQAACPEALQALSPGPELTAVAELAESLGGRLGEKPTTGLAASNS